ncbi:unnamed protein product [Paramecium primaurelia]|uniref:Uncharacterized protein n=1 Tax=Paramecium primaurelia TaxID=5886 RepID=A0A8S1N1F5_PARPR|nr:unnamed protein product [Paramecium primaurelia]
MKSLTSKDYINKYTHIFQESLPLCIQYRKDKEWDQIIYLIGDHIKEFDKLPNGIKQKVDQFTKSSLYFFLAEAQYHLKQSLTAEGLLDLDTNDEKINQIKAKTYFMLYKQTNKIEHIEYAAKLAEQFFGTDHKISQFYQTELEQRQRKIKFLQLQSIPNFEVFKQGLEFQYFKHQSKKEIHQKKGRNMHLSEIEKLTTEASTFEPSKRIRYKGNESLLKISDQKMNLFLPLQSSNINSKSIIQFRQNNITSELRGSHKLDSVQDVPIEGNNIQELLLQRPQSCKQRHPKKLVKNQPSPQKHHHQQSSLSQQQQQNRNTLLKRSQIKLHQQNLMKSSSKQRIDIKEQSQQKILDSKSIQCEMSEQSSYFKIDQQRVQQDLDFHFSPRIGQSYYSLNTSTGRSKHQIDNEYLHNRLDGLYKIQQEHALRMIIKNFRSFVQKQKIQKSQDLMKKSTAKQHFSNLVVEVGATKNMLIEEKIARIKQILHICQVIDQGSLKSWMIYSPIKQINAVSWKIKNFSWIIFKRLKTKKTQIHPDIIKLYKETPKYRQIIEVWSNSIDGTNAIFVLSISIEIKGKQYDIRLHLKNIQNISKDFENTFSSTELISQLINVYFQSHGIQYNNSIKPTTQFIQTKQTLLRQDILKKGCQNISNHLNQLFLNNFLYMRTENGYKFRRVTFSEQVLENQVELYRQIEQRRNLIKKTFSPFHVGSRYFGIKNSNLRNQKLLKSLSIAIELQSPVLQSRGMSPYNYWQGLRSQSFKVEFQDEIIEESSFTPKSGFSQASPRSSISPQIRQKNNTFSSFSQSSSNLIKKTNKKQKPIIDDYFKNYPKQREIILKDSIPFNPYQSQQILLLYLTRNKEGWHINYLTFTFNFENPENFGHFILHTYQFQEKEIIQICYSLQQFSKIVNIDIYILKIYLGYYRNIPYITKLNYMKQINQLQEFTYKTIINNNFYECPEYKITKRIERKSLINDNSQINKDHYYIFIFKPLNQLRIIFKIKQSFFKGKEIYELYMYKISQPKFIQINNSQSLIKLQELFQKIIHQQSRPTIGEFQQLQRVLNYYILQEYKANGSFVTLGFQNQTKQIFNYELKSSSTQEIYKILLKHLVANEQSHIKNLLRTYWMNLLQFTQYLMEEDIMILEILIFPFEKRLSSFKTYLNHNDLQTFQILNHSVEEKALFLKNLLSLQYNGNSQQVHLSLNSNFKYVNQIIENLGQKEKTNLFIKQKQAIKLIFQKVKKLSKHFLIVSLFQNTLNHDLIIQIYIPNLCKQFRSVMSDYEFGHLNQSTLDKIIPGNILENLDQYLNQFPQRYNNFIQFMRQKKLQQIDDQFSIKSRLSERSGISSISIQKFKDQYEQMLMNQQQSDQSHGFNHYRSQAQSQTGHQQQTQMKQSQKILRSESKKPSSRTYFGKLSHPQRVSHDVQIFKERVSVKPSISKFDTFYDSIKLQKILKIAALSKNISYKFIMCYFWEQMIEDSNIIMTNYNKYILQIDTYRGILRQLGVSKQVFIEDDYQAEIFFEQQQVEYGSMFEKYSFISLKESQSTNIYFSYKKLDGSIQKTINLKCQFRQCIYNYSSLNQISYNTALRILKQSSEYLTDQIKNKKKVIEFPKVDIKSIQALRTNKKSIKLETYINNHSKYKFIYSSRLMMNVIVTILYKNERFYFYLEDCQKQIEFSIKMSIKSVQDNIPHISMLLQCQQEYIIGQRLLSTYKNFLIIKAYEKLFKFNN